MPPAPPTLFGLPVDLRATLAVGLLAVAVASYGQFMACQRARNPGDRMSRSAKLFLAGSFLAMVCFFAVLISAFDLFARASRAYAGIPVHWRGALLGVAATALAGRLLREVRSYYLRRIERHATAVAESATAAAKVAEEAAVATARATAASSAATAHETMLRIRGLYYRCEPALREAEEFFNREIVAVAVKKCTPEQALLADFLRSFVLASVKSDKKALDEKIAVSRERHLTASEFADFATDLVPVITARYWFLLYWLKRGGLVVLGHARLTSSVSYAALNSQHSIFLDKLAEARDWPELPGLGYWLHELHSVFLPPSPVDAAPSQGEGISY